MQKRFAQFSTPLIVAFFSLLIFSQPAAAGKKNPMVTMETSKGQITMELYPKNAPLTVSNYVKLIRDKYYDGLTFHRYVKNFVIQGGDPKGNGTGGPGYTIKDEHRNGLKHVPGALAMAKTAAPNSAGSQFYICLKAAPFLDNQYTVFGQVVNGMDVVIKLRQGDVMKKVTVAE